MAITFQNIPNTQRTPAVLTEVDNSRALKGLIANPHKVLIIGQMESPGTASKDELKAVSSDGLANGFFGPGSILARMCNAFKAANPNTELYAMALSENAAGVAASGDIGFTGSASGAGTLYLTVGGRPVYTPIASGWSGIDVASAVHSDINGNSLLCMTASLHAVSLYRVLMVAVGSCAVGNEFDFRLNYYEGQSNPVGVTTSVVSMAGGSNSPDLGDAWAIIENEQFQHIIQPYTDATNLTELEKELATRFGPLVDLFGHGYTAARTTLASATTLGNTRNSPHNTIMAANNSPTNPDEWAAVTGAVAAASLNQDPARPLHYLKLPGILPPPIEDRFTLSERNILLYDGIATWITDSTGNVLLERCITTYQSNALGLADPSYLDIQTLFTLAEIRYQYKSRMTTRFLLPRFKLADEGFPVQPGSSIVTPSTVKYEIIALFTLLRDQGLIENLDDFVKNVVVERDATDVNRVNVLLPPDLINQFRIMANLLQFIL